MAPVSIKTVPPLEISRQAPALKIQAPPPWPFFRFQSPGAPACLLPVSLIDRHILREWLKIFSLVLGATLGLLLMQSLYDDFEDLL